jgi:hypothetical protein
MDETDILPRIGTFFIIMGIAFFAYFMIAVSTADTIDYDSLFYGAVSTGFGYFFRRNVKPRPSTERFAWLRNYLANMQKKDKKKKKN